MQVDEFNRIKGNRAASECRHERTDKLYYLGAHWGFGCLDCGSEWETREAMSKAKTKQT